MTNQISSDSKGWILSLIKSILYYWVAVAVVPFLMFYLVKDEKSIFYYYVVPVFLIIILVSPFLFTIPYRRVKKNMLTRKARILYVIFGAVIPYLILYLFVINEIMNMGAPHF